MLSDKIKRDLKKIVDRKIQSKLDVLKDQAEKLKQEMINEFWNHPITKEINEGPYSENISGTLTGYGNLFTFIGFEFGSDPITPIISILHDTDIQIISRFGNSFLNIKIPTAEEIWNATPMPWQEGRSWAKGIESGISGLNYYLYLQDRVSDNSRSSRGLQANKLRSNLRYIPRAYISNILKKYKTKFSSIGRRDQSVFTSII